MRSPKIGDVECIDRDYIVSNGPAFSRDGGTIYHTDSARRTIFALRKEDAGQGWRKRVLITFEAADGYPDGMTTDAEGNLWVAMWDGGCIRKLSPRGERLGAVRMPVTRPTSCVIVDGDFYVTSASIGAGADDALAGGLFRVRLV